VETRLLAVKHGTVRDGGAASSPASIHRIIVLTGVWRHPDWLRDPSGAVFLRRSIRCSFELLIYQSAGDMVTWPRCRAAGRGDCYPGPGSHGPEHAVLTKTGLLAMAALQCMDPPGFGR